MLVHRYCSPTPKAWKQIVKYWFCNFLRPITNEDWSSNNYPHCSDESEIPLYFRQCLDDFRDYHSKFGYTVNDNLSTKIIYGKLINENQHRPAVVRRYSDMIQYFPNVKKSKFLDPFLKEFLFKLYHCRLFFKRFRLNINDLLNFDRQQCILCQRGIDTPKHLFTRCRYGYFLRQKREELFNKYEIQQNFLTEEVVVYSVLKNDDNALKVTQFIITLSNYIMYKHKMKKFYNITTNVNSDLICKEFIGKLKFRILSDHKRLPYESFIDLWDPGGSVNNPFHDRNKINNWSFVNC